MPGPPCLCPPVLHCRPWSWALAQGQCFPRPTGPELAEGLGLEPAKKLGDWVFDFPGATRISCGTTMTPLLTNLKVGGVPCALQWNSRQWLR